MEEDVSRRSVSLYVSGGKLTARVLAKGLAKLLEAGKNHHAKKQGQPRGRQSMKKLHRRYQPKKVEFSGATRLFDRIVKENNLNVDYAFFKTGPKQYDLFFSGPSTDEIDTAYRLYVKEVLGKKRSPRMAQVQKEAGEKARQHNKQRHKTREAARGDR